MEKVVGKEFPLEKQRDMLEEMNALKLPLLYQNLVAAYGEEKGRAVYDDIFEVGFKKRSKMFEGKDIGNIMMYEIDMFPATGWKIWIEKTEENGSRCGMSTWSAAPILMPPASASCLIPAPSSARWTAAWESSTRWRSGSG
jgi:hypothetical protein